MVQCHGRREVLLLRVAGGVHGMAQHMPVACSVVIAIAAQTCKSTRDRLACGFWELHVPCLFLAGEGDQPVPCGQGGRTRGGWQRGPGTVGNRPGLKHMSLATMPDGIFPAISTATRWPRHHCGLVQHCVSGTTRVALTVASPPARLPSKMYLVDFVSEVSAASLSAETFGI